MKEYAECFRNNLKPNQCGMSIPKEEGIERINVVIFGLKNTTMIPYILYIARDKINQVYFCVRADFIHYMTYFKKMIGTNMK